MSETQTESTFEGWAIIELMGHRRLAGYVREVELAGHGVLRLDVPGYTHTEPTGEQEERGATTQFYSPSALYCLTPTTGDVARRLSMQARPRPVHAYELPPAPAPRADEVEEFEPELLDDDEPDDREPF